MKNATEFCKLVERRLGWEAPAGGERRRYMAEAAKVNRAIAKDPLLYTWSNLELTVALLGREKKSRTPVGVLVHVQRALDLALDVEVDVEEEIRTAVGIETAAGDPDGWVTRFSRAVGYYRTEALREWQASR